MEKKTPTPMTPFDERTVPKELHMLKLLLPYTPAASRQALGILVKVIELQHTIQYFDRQKSLLHEQDFSSGFSSPLEMLEEISPYLPPEQANMLETFRNMMNIMDMVQMMQAFSADTGNTEPNSDSADGKASFRESGESEKKESSADPGASGGGTPFMGFGGSGGGFDPMQLVMGMLSPEQKDMFEMYQTMFSQPGEPAAPEASSGDGSKAGSSSHTSAEWEKNAGTETADTGLRNMETEDVSPQNGKSQNAESWNDSSQNAESWNDSPQNVESWNNSPQNAEIERMDTEYE